MPFWGPLGGYMSRLEAVYYIFVVVVCVVAYAAKIYFHKGVI